MSEPKETKLQEQNGFEAMRARLREEYLANVADVEGIPLDTLSDLQRMYESSDRRIRESENQLRQFYRQCGQVVGERLIALATEEGLDDTELVRIVRQDIEWTEPTGLLIKDIVDPYFVITEQDEVPLISQDEIMRETVNGLSYRIAEHLGIE